MTLPPHPLVLVAGAGAIGCTLAARLHHAGVRVRLLARGRTLAALQGSDLQLDDLEGTIRARLPVVTQPDETGTPDLVFLCCKSQDLPTLARQIRPAIGPQTLVVPLCNGVPFWYFQNDGHRFQNRAVEAVDPDGRLLADLPMERVLGAVVFITAEVLEASHVRSRTPHLVMLGETGQTDSTRLESVCDLLRRAGIEARAETHIRDKLWTKLIANLTSNPLSVVSGATLDTIYTRPDLLATVYAVMHEAMLVACAHGARLEIDPFEFVRLGAAMGPFRTSMLQDFERGRPLELAAIGDAVLELGRLYDLAMPATQALIQAARTHRLPAAVGA